MTRDQLQQHWDWLEDEVRSVWAELTESDLLEIRGDADRLIEAVRRRYHYDRLIAEDEVGRFLARYTDTSFARLRQTA